MDHKGCRMGKNVDTLSCLHQEAFIAGMKRVLDLAIDGYPKVFIPSKFHKYISLNEIFRMDLKYDITHSYPLIATFIHKKVEPYVAAKIISSNDDEYMKVHIPKQDIGKMIGKLNGMMRGVNPGTRMTGNWSKDHMMMKNQMKLLIGDDGPRLGENRATTLELR